MSVTTGAPKAGEVTTLDITKRVTIEAPREVAWEAVLEELREFTPEKGKMKFTLEAWPGGRYFRDLGEGRGNFWAHVQVIKAPDLIELCGPLFMSYPAVSHVQYKLADKDGGCELVLRHRAFGMIDPEHAKGVQQGWGQMAEAIAAGAHARMSKGVSR